MPATLFASDIQNLVLPSTKIFGLFGVIGHFENSTNSSTRRNKLSCDNGSGSNGVSGLAGPQANGTYDIRAFCCTAPGNANFSVWLSDDPAVNGTATVMINSTMVFEDCLNSTSLTKGCAAFTPPTQVYLPGNESDINITIPVQVNCGVENTTDYVLGVKLSTQAKVCYNSGFVYRSCAIRSFNLTFPVLASANCSAPVGSTGSIELQYFSPADYEASKNKSWISYWANFRVDQNFRVSGPFVVQTIVPGTPTTAVVGNVSVVTPASLLPSGLNGALILEINDPNASASVIAAVDVKLDNGSAFSVQNLSVPLQVTFPLFPPTPCKDSVCHYWDVKSKAWSTEGCETLQSAAGEWICSCTHATDFSILLIDSPSCAAELAPTLEPFYAYSSLYILLGLLAMYSGFRVIALKSGHCGIILEHLGVVAICGIRTFLSLYQLGVSGPVTAVALSTISAVPRLLEFAVFSFIIATWGALLHFSMGTSNPYRKARPYFIGVNVFAAAIVCYVFISFAVSPSYDMAIIGEALLGFNSLLLSLGFLVYATWLHKQFGKAGRTSTATTVGKLKACCNSRTKVVYLGWLLSFSFVAQSVFACLALTAIPRDGTVSVDVTEARFFIDLYNGLFRLFNITTLGCIIALYWDGIRKIVAKESSASRGESMQHSSSQYSMQSMS